MPKHRTLGEPNPGRSAKSSSAARISERGKVAAAPSDLTEVQSFRGVVLVDQSDLYELVGYSCRRAHAHVFGYAADALATYDLPPGWFTVLTLLVRNPGLSSRQMCQVLGVKPPNFVALVSAFEARGLIERRMHPEDRRSLGLYLTSGGRRLAKSVREHVVRAEREATSMLDDEERRTLLILLRRMFEGSRHRPPAVDDDEAVA